jgi:hypothetical protein
MATGRAALIHLFGGPKNGRPNLRGGRRSGYQPAGPPRPDYVPPVPGPDGLLHAQPPGHLPGRPNTRYPGSGHPPPRGRPPKFPPDARPPEDHPFGGTLTRAQVLERYQKYGDTPQEELQAYRDRLQRIAQGREIGHRQGVSAAQGQGSVSSDQRSTRGDLIARSGPVGTRLPGKPNRGGILVAQPIAPGEFPPGPGPRHMPPHGDVIYPPGHHVGHLPPGTRVHSPERGDKPDRPTFGGPKNGKPNLTRQQILIQLLQRRRAMGRARNL